MANSPPEDENTERDMWTSLDPESLVAAKCLIEQTLCQPGDEGQPQLAKDVDYATAVLDAWKEQEADDDGRTWNTETRRVVYHDPEDGTPLYGRLIRRSVGGSSNTEQDGSEKGKVPGIILFHTAAGPHDLFLQWKAAALVNSLPRRDGSPTAASTDATSARPRGCVVFIADLLSDASGWGWDADRTRYGTARERVLAVDTCKNSDNEEELCRPVLQRRIRAAVDTLLEVSSAAGGDHGGPVVDEARLAALGWCFGGFPILELARMQLPGMRAMATFHGVFGKDRIGRTTKSAPSDARSEVLICHGTHDPFVASESLELALAAFQNGGHVVSLLQLSNAKHGFTNPAQDFNPNSDAFGFDAAAASKAWRQSLALLQRKCFS